MCLFLVFVLLPWIHTHTCICLCPPCSSSPGHYSHMQHIEGGVSSHFSPSELSRRQLAAPWRAPVPEKKETTFFMTMVCCVLHNSAAESQEIKQHGSRLNTTFFQGNYSSSTVETLILPYGKYSWKIERVKTVLESI